MLFLLFLGPKKGETVQFPLPWYKDTTFFAEIQIATFPEAPKF
jgi:hypothetical protein